MRRDRYEDDDASWNVVGFEIMVGMMLVAFIGLLGSDAWSAYESLQHISHVTLPTPNNLVTSLLIDIATSLPSILVAAMVYVICCVISMMLRAHAVAFVGWLVGAVTIVAIFYGHHQGLLESWLICALAAVSAAATTCEPLYQAVALAPVAKSASPSAQGLLQREVSDVLPAAMLATEYIDTVCDRVYPAN